MSVYRRAQALAVDHDQPLAARVAQYLRDRRDSGLPHGATVDMVGKALKVTDRQAIREALAVLVAHGHATEDHGPQGLADQRQPDRWSAS